MRLHIINRTPNQVLKSLGYYNAVV